MDSLACVDHARGYKMSVWASKSVWEMSVKSRCPCGRVGLCRLQQRKVNPCLYGRVILCGLCQWQENVRVDGLVCTRHDRERKMYARTSKLVQTMTVKWKHPDERINVYVGRRVWVACNHINARLQVRVSFLKVRINVLHLNIPLFRETLRGRLENSAQVKK